MFSASILLALTVVSVSTFEFKSGNGCIPKKTLYRLWSGGSSDHFYTTDAAERDNAVAQFGYSYEGEIGYLASGLSAACGELRPLFRMWNSKTSDHFYTIDASERNNAVNLGYQKEGITGFCSANPACGANVPLHRFFNGRVNDHFYTTDANEANSLISGQTPNYDYEGIACYLWKQNACSTTDFV